MIDQSKIEEYSQKLSDKIAMLFLREGYLTYSSIPFHVCEKVINKESQRLFFIDFKREILEEVWEQCASNRHGEVCLKSLAETFVEAFQTLNSKIMTIEKPNGLFDDRVYMLKERQKELKLYKNEENDRRVHALEIICEEIE